MKGKKVEVTQLPQGWMKVNWQPDLIGKTGIIKSVDKFEDGEEKVWVQLDEPVRCPQGTPYMAMYFQRSDLKILKK